MAEPLARVSKLLEDLVLLAESSAAERCPYEDAKGRCTAPFGCRNQRRAAGALACAGQGLLKLERIPMK